MTGPFHPITRRREGANDIVVQGRLQTRVGFVAKDADVGKGDLLIDALQFGGHTYKVASVIPVLGHRDIHHLKVNIRRIAES